MRWHAEGIARKSAGLGPGGRPKSGITEGFADGSWVLGGAGGADRLQAELRAASRYGTGAAPQPCRALALPAKISPRVSDDGATRCAWSYRLQSYLPAPQFDGNTPADARSASRNQLPVPWGA